MTPGPRRADLHLHTHCSDGVLPPREVLQLARRAGLHTVAISDHDTLAGFDEVRSLAPRLGLTLIPAVEVGIEFDGDDVHVLAYFVDPNHRGLRRLLTGLRRARRRRIRTMIQRLRCLGFPLRMAQVRKQVAPKGTMGRPHLAQALAAAGWVETYSDSFRFYLGKDCPAYLPNQTPSPEDVIGILLAAGGVPVLAHPGAYRSPAILDRFLCAGVMGLEVIHPRQTPEDSERLRQLALRLDLVQTGGSDFHGGGRGDAPPGSYAVSEEMLDRLEKSQDQVRGVLRRLHGDQ